MGLLLSHCRGNQASSRIGECHGVSQLWPEAWDPLEIQRAPLGTSPVASGSQAFFQVARAPWDSF